MTTSTTRPHLPERARSAGRSFRDSLIPASRTGRRLALCATVDSITIGVFLASATLYFVGFLGISAVTIGMVLAVANITGIISPIPLGVLADRIGARRVYVALMMVRAGGFVAYMFVTETVGFLLVTCVISSATRGCLPLLQVIIGELEDPATLTRTRASMRALNNMGLTVGLLLVGLVQVADSGPAFLGLFGFNALAMVTVAGTMLAAGRLATVASTAAEAAGPSGPTVPAASVEPVRRPKRRVLSRRPAATEGRPRQAGPSPFTDRRFLVVAAGNSVLMLHDAVLFVLLPLWILRNDLPAGAVPVLLAVNTTLTIGLQLYIARFVSGVANALRVLRAAGAVLAAACAFFVLAETQGRVIGLALVALAVVVLTVGENMHSAAAWELSFEMSPLAARARYLSLFSATASAELVFGPFLMTAVILPARALGWLILALIFVLATAAVVLAARPHPHISEGTS